MRREYNNNNKRYNTSELSSWRPSIINVSVKKSGRTLAALRLYRIISLS
jgi:hypothetical protein